MSVVVVVTILDLMVCFVVFHSGVSCCERWGSQPKNGFGVAIMTGITQGPPHELTHAHAKPL